MGRRTSGGKRKERMKGDRMRGRGEREKKKKVDEGWFGKEENIQVRAEKRTSGGK